jgi:hypothetical protein
MKRVKRKNGTTWTSFEIISVADLLVAAILLVFSLTAFFKGKAFEATVFLSLGYIIYRLKI